MRRVFLPLLVLLIACDGPADPDAGSLDAGADAGGLPDAGGETCSASDLGAWRALDPLPAPRESAGVLIAASTLHVFGGWDGSGASDTGWHATIAADGSLGTWRTDEALPRAVERAVPAAVGGHVVLVGGDDGVSAALADVYVGSLAPAGGVSGWRSTTALPGPRLEHAVVTRGSDLIVVGGVDGLGGAAVSEVLVASVGSDGSVGMWRTAAPLPGGFTGSRAAVVGDRLYVIGRSVTGSELHSAPLATLDAWRPEGASPAAANAELIALGPSLLSVGGLDGTAGVAATHRSPVSGDGTLPGWTPGEDLVAARFGHRLASSAGHVFAVGGWLSLGTLTDTVFVASCP